MESECRLDCILTQLTRIKTSRHGRPKTSQEIWAHFTQEDTVREALAQRLKTSIAWSQGVSDPSFAGLDQHNCVQKRLVVDCPRTHRKSPTLTFLLDSSLRSPWEGSTAQRSDAANGTTSASSSGRSKRADRREGRTSRPNVSDEPRDLGLQLKRAPRCQLMGPLSMSRQGQTRSS